MDFGEALDEMKTHGAHVARKGWNGQGMYVALQMPDQFSKIGRPYLYMKPMDGNLVPWVASQSDLLGEDWVIA